MASDKKRIRKAGKASEGDLANLHGALAQTMTKKLEAGDYTTADLNTIRQFLKDNDISCDPAGNKDIQDVLANIPPDFDELEEQMKQEHHLTQ